MDDLRAGLNKVAVCLPSFYQEEVVEGELKLVIDPKFNPTKWVNTRARIVGLPLDLDKDYTPFLQALSKSEYLYFDYKALEEMDYVLDKNKDRVYFVPIELAYAATIESTPHPQIFPNTGIVLCESFHGFGVEEIEVMPGTKMKAQIKSGIIYRINPPADDRIAYVRYVGPYRSDTPLQPLEPGQLVFRDPHTNYEYEIAGKKLYVVNLENVNGVLYGTDFSYRVSDSVRNEYKYDVDATSLARQSAEALEWTSKEKKIFATS